MMLEVAPFQRSAPEAQGIRSEAILAFVDAADRTIRDLHSFILLRHGAVVAEGYWEPFGPSYPHLMFSLSKSFTSTAIGLLVAEGRLTVDERVLDLFADQAPAEPSDNLQAMRVRHLLTMTTGHHTDPTMGLRQSSGKWRRVFLAEPIEHEPGTHFVYNSVATYMLSAIVQQITGQRLLDYLRPRLFEPLSIANPTWESSPEGIDVGGWGLSITTSDIARFGLLYLQRGAWGGKQLLPAAWVDEATARQVPNGPSESVDWVQGYGYQFWRCQYGAYRGDGAFGQFCIVMPEQAAVLAITAGVSNMQSVLDLVWQHLLPAMDVSPLPENASAQQALGRRLADLRLSPTAGQLDSPHSTALSGHPYALAENSARIDRARFDFRPGATTLSLAGERGEQTIPCGHGEWLRSEGSVLAARGTFADSAGPAKVAASGAWTDDQTYVADLCWYETPFRRRLTCRFEGERLTVDQQLNVSLVPTELPRLEGRLV
jgi:CubicO group peptidase (beta-lactamase class C family)